MLENRETFKSGFVTIVGKTNVGKSSIINRLVGEKVSAVTHRTQTTRKNVRGIVTLKDSQIIFIDTPGLHKSKTKLSEVMNEEAVLSIPNVDIILYVIDVTEKEVDEKTLEIIKNSKKKVILIINKVDLTSPENVLKLIKKYSELHSFDSIVAVSVLKNHNIETILEEIKKLLPEGPKYYEDDDYTTQTMREIVEEVVREKVLKLLQDEVPHGVLVETVKLKTKKNLNQEKFFDIEANIFCIRQSHKGIIIGKQGQMLKKIGMYARQDLETMFGEKVNLKLWVKVKEDWINDLKIIKRFKSE